MQYIKPLLNQSCYFKFLLILLDLCFHTLHAMSLDVFRLDSSFRFGPLQVQVLLWSWITWVGVGVQVVSVSSWFRDWVVSGLELFLILGYFESWILRFSKGFFTQVALGYHKIKLILCSSWVFGVISGLRCHVKQVMSGLPPVARIYPVFGNGPRGIMDVKVIYRWWGPELLRYRNCTRV